MSSVVGATVLALLMLGIAALGAVGFRRRDLPDDESSLRQLRRLSESRDLLAMLAAFGVLNLVAGTATLVREGSIGAVWLVPAFLFAVAAVVAVRSRRDLRARLGDRGRTRRTEAHERRLARARALAVAGFVGWFGARVVRAAVGEPEPEWASVLVGCFGVLFVVGVLGWLAVRTVSYAKGDDLDERPAD